MTNQLFWKNNFNHYDGSLGGGDLPMNPGNSGDRNTAPPNQDNYYFDYAGNNSSQVWLSTELGGGVMKSQGGNGVLTAIYFDEAGVISLSFSLRLKSPGVADPGGSNIKIPLYIDITARDSNGYFRFYTKSRKFIWYGPGGYPDFSRSDSWQNTPTSIWVDAKGAPNTSNSPPFTQNIAGYEQTYNVDQDATMWQTSGMELDSWMSVNMTIDKSQDRYSFALYGAGGNQIAGFVKESTESLQAMWGNRVQIQIGGGLAENISNPVMYYDNITIGNYQPAPPLPDGNDLPPGSPGGDSSTKPTPTPKPTTKTTAGQKTILQLVRDFSEDVQQEVRLTGHRQITMMPTNEAVANGFGATQVDSNFSQSRQFVQSGKPTLKSTYDDDNGEVVSTFVSDDDAWLTSNFRMPHNVVHPMTGRRFMTKTVTFSMNKDGCSGTISGHAPKGNGLPSILRKPED